MGGGGGSGKVHPEGGGEGEQKRVGVVLTWVLEVLTILQGGAKGFLHLKGRGGRVKNALPCLEGGWTCGFLIS